MSNIYDLVEKKRRVKYFIVLYCIMVRLLGFIRFVGGGHCLERPTAVWGLGEQVRLGLKG